MPSMTSAFLAVLLSIGIAGKTNGQQPTLVDLATEPYGQSVTRSTAPGTMEVTVVNRLPNSRYKYGFSYLVRNLPIESIVFPSSDESADTGVEIKAACTNLKNAIKTFGALTEEREVPKGRRTLQAALEAGSDCALSVRTQARQLLDLTEQGPYRVTLRAGQEAQVTITRTDTQDGTSRTWNFVYTTGARGSWRTLYALAFVPNIIAQDEHYFTEVSGSAFEIRRGSKRTGIDYVPAVLFGWMSTESELSNWAWSFTGGLGFDLSAPVALLGANLTYNQNVSFVFGAAAHSQRRLLARYRDRQIVPTNLEENQLHESIFRFNPFVAVAFRFQTNPFSRRSDGEEETPPPAEGDE